MKVLVFLDVSQFLKGITFSLEVHRLCVCVLLLRVALKAKKNTQHWLADTEWGRGKLKYLEKNLSQCHFVHHKLLGE
jgi:hypothetical protein